MDGGSFSEILYEHCFNRFCPEVRSQMVPATTPLVRFSGEIIWPLGQISLLVKIGDEEHSTSAWMNFMVVRSPSPYNGIIGRPRVRRIQAVPSTAHGMLKFPVTGRTVTLRSSMIIPLECTMVSGPGGPQPVINQVTEEKIQELYGLLRRNLDIFAWKPTDMTGVSCHIAERRLYIREGCLPVRQKKRGQAPERNKAIYEEVEKLLENVCGFQGLKQSLPKDSYPLPKIDWKVESLCGYPFKCFMDAYKGYHQIKMAKEDEEKTTFITSQGIFCYAKMSFGLKNVGATYQRLVDKAFQKQIGRNLEVYVDDLVIKSRTKREVISDIEETFKTLREINMKLNPKKCTFGMREGTFLGYKVNVDGLNKVEAVLSLPYPKCLKDMQRLNGKLASLNRFLSKSAERSLPFFKSFKKCTKKSDFQWIAKAETAFKQMKKSIAELPMLATPKEKEELIIYLAAAKEAISAVLMTERDGKQVPIYFVSRALQGPEINYTPMEKLILALILSNLEVTGRLLKWSFELEEHDIHYRPRTSVKGQILADFIVERPEDDPSDTPMEDEEELPDPWILFTDRSSCIDGSGAGLILTSLEGMEFTYALRFRFDATNNEAEYEALIAGLRIAEQMGVKNLQANVDSRLVANQVNGTYIAKEPGMIQYLEKFRPPEQTTTCRGAQRKINRLKGSASGSRRRRTHMDDSNPRVPHRINSSRRKEEGKSYTPQDRCQKIDKGMQQLSGSPSRAKEPQQNLTPITSPWPFYKWGINIPGPFPKGPGEIISDNGKQFRDNPFKDWCEKLCIRQCFASVKHPQANGLVERANRSLGEGVKARLEERSKNWMEEIPHVLWAHRTMIKSSNDETPFSLTYGTKAVIPVEIGMPTLRTAKVDMVKNDEALEINLELLEEKREQAAIQEAKSKAKMEKYYNARVRNTSFRPGDFVYRNNEASHAEDGGKLEPKWEGPYEVTEALGKGAYKLRDRNGNILPRTWNVCNLKKCYVHEM
ncbi:reverse transcriptase domain-containing protein [Tanacetum coccineum]